MNHVIVIQFITLDGVIEDPDGSGGSPDGGWAFRFGREEIAGDKFQLSTQLDTGTLLFGRATWQLFAKLWPGRSDPFSTQLNTAPKRVASRTLTDVSAWRNSSLLEGELAGEVARLREESDVIVMGSTSVVHELMRQELVDEYRLLVFPIVLGRGSRLFNGQLPAGDLRLISAEQSGACALLRYETAGR